MSNHVSAHVRGSVLTDTSWQSDAFAIIKKVVPLQRDNSSIVNTAVTLTSVRVNWENLSHQSRKIHFKLVILE